jgi:hypothetical protein
VYFGEDIYHNQYFDENYVEMRLVYFMKHIRSHKFYVALLVGCVNDAKYFTCSYTLMSKNIVMN